MPPLTLHVLPPAFALPSISPDCITAIAYLRYTQHYGNWIVVADAAEYPNHNAPFVIPAHHYLETAPLPIEGLDAIIQHLSSKSSNGLNLENNLDASQQSVATALSSHLQMRLWPLVTLSLYVCSENYSSATRPSFGAVLPFPESWILPHRLHKYALESCTHLGIEPQDLGSLGEGSRKSEKNTVADAGPSAEAEAAIGLKQNESKSTIASKIKLQRKIDDLVYNALSPFVDCLDLPRNSSRSTSATQHASHRSSKDFKALWLFSASNPSPADLMALGLLSLALLPYTNSKSGSSNKEPFLTLSFLPDSIHRQFPDLVSSYLLPGLEDAFTGKTSFEQALFSAPLAATSAEEDEDDGAYEDAIQDYGNLDVGSGKVEIPWRRRKKGDSWEGVRRVSNAIGAVLGEAVGM